MNKIQKTLSLILFAAVLLLIVFLPKYVGTLRRPGYIDWLRPSREQFRGTLTVWHVVRFRPYLGSIGAWMKKYASVMEKRHFGVYLNVESMTEEDAAVRIAAGEMPDIISFPPGFIQAKALMPLSVDVDVNVNGGVYGEHLLALPFAASCRLIIYYPGRISQEEITSDRTAAAKYSFDEFKAEKAPCCIADARQAGDMARLVSSNKAQHFEALPFEDRAKLVQFLGVSASLADEKRKYAEEYVELLASMKAQSELPELGLMPLNESVVPKYETGFLEDAYKLIKDGKGTEAFAFEGGE